MDGGLSEKIELERGRPRERTRGLGSRLERVARAVIEAIFARDEGGELVAPPEARVSWVCHELDDFLARVTLRSFVIVVAALVATSVVAPLMIRRFAGLASLPLPDRVRALEALEKSPFSPALLLVKVVTSLHYYENPDAAREVGFDGGCLLSESRK